MLFYKFQRARKKPFKFKQFYFEFYGKSVNINSSLAKSRLAIIDLCAKIKIFEMALSVELLENDVDKFVSELENQSRASVIVFIVEDFLNLP